MYHIWRPKTLHRHEQYLAINNADLDSGASPLSADEVQTLQHLLQRFQSSGSDQNLRKQHTIFLCYNSFYGSGHIVFVLSVIL